MRLRTSSSTENRSINLPVENFIAPLAVIDISERAKRDPNTMVTVDDIKAWEKRYGRLQEGAVVFMYSGWGKKVHDPKAFVNLDASNTMPAPGFAPETAEFLIHKRDIVGIGVDTLSIDTGRSKDFPVHKSWRQVGCRVRGEPRSSAAVRRYRLRRRD